MPVMQAILESYERFQAGAMRAGFRCYLSFRDTVLALSYHALPQYTLKQFTAEQSTVRRETGELPRLLLFDFHIHGSSGTENLRPAYHDYVDSHYTHSHWKNWATGVGIPFVAPRFLVGDAEGNVLLYSLKGVFDPNERRKELDEELTMLSVKNPDAGTPPQPTCLYPTMPPASYILLEGPFQAKWLQLRKNLHCHVEEDFLAHPNAAQDKIVQWFKPFREKILIR